MLFCFNTLIVGDKEYSMADVKYMVPPDRFQQEFGIDEDFYGGRLVGIGKTDSDVLIMVTKDYDGGTVALDAGAVNLENLPFPLLKTLARRRKLKVEKTMTKEEVIKLLHQ